MKENMKRRGENKQKMKEGNKIIFGQKTSNDIIAENKRERFMIELKLIEKMFFKVLLYFYNGSLPCIHSSNPRGNGMIAISKRKKGK